jgi:ATP-binding cassette, subfamily B, multidrug efflux pump
MTISNQEEAPRKTYDHKLAIRLLSYLRPYKLYAVSSLGLLLINVPLALAGPPLVKAAVDLFLVPVTAGKLTASEVVLKKGAESWGFGGNAYRGILLIAIVFFLAHVVSFIVQYAQAMLLQTMGQHIICDLRRALFEKLQRIPISFYDQNPVGRLMTRLTTDVDTLNEMFTGGLIVICGDIAVASYIIFYMFRVNWRLALVAFSILPLLIFLSIIFRRGSRRAFREIRAQTAQLNGFLHEHISGMSIIQLFNREPREMAKFEEVNDAHRKASLHAVFYIALFSPAVELLGAAGIALILWHGSGQILAKMATIGTIIAFIQLTRSFYEPISDISDRYSILQSSLASAERIFQLLDEPEETSSGVQSAPGTSSHPHIEFRNVWFAYHQDQWVLKDVSFTVEAGERVAFVGHTGAGKSTLTNLLLRFYEIQSGQILLNGVDIRKMALADLRANFGLVHQDVFLFTGDISSNIRLGNEEITAEQIRAAAEAANADVFIRRLPDGYATEVSERGNGLSVGQKQLISFARALAFDSPVLILDEATSSIDSETEFLIGNAVQHLMAGRTSLVIAHRLATINSVDKIILLHKGEVREVGTHQSLTRQQGLYQQLYQLQFGVSAQCETNEVPAFV